MQIVFRVLAAVIGIYSLIIFIRIIFSWFRNLVSGRLVEIISKVTDPYLNWWRKRLNLRIGIIDFSAVAGIMFLYLLQNIFSMISAADKISIGMFLSVIILSLWPMVSFILGFCIIVIVLRMIAYLTNRYMFSQFWGMVDSISKPILYRINRIVFGSKIPGFLNGIIVSLLILIVIFILARVLIYMFASFLYNLPI